jgi:hypothetical protein
MLGPLGKIGDWLSQHSNTLLAMGAGLTGAPNIWQGLGRGFAFAGPAAQQDIKMQTLMSGQNAAFNALIAAGVPRDLAMAGATDKDVMKQLMENYVTGNKYEFKEVKVPGLLGEKTRIMAVNPRDPSDAMWTDTGQPVNPNAARGGRPIGPAGTGQMVQQPGGGGGGTTEGVGLFAPGVNEDTYQEQGLGPDQYIAQFSPSTQQAIKDRVNGLMPISGTGARAGASAAQNAFLTRAAEYYGASIGKPMDVASVAGRREWATSVANSKSGVGLQIKGLEQGLDHFVDIVDTAEKMNLSGGMGLERVARGINRLKAEGTGQSDLISHAGVIGQALAGEIGKLNGGSAGGGVHEREAAKAYLADPYHSRNSAAGAFEGALGLLEGGIDALEGRRDQLFGSDPKNWPKGSDFLGEKQQAQIQHVRDVIARLRSGESAPAAAAKAAPAVQGTAGPANLPHVKTPAEAQALPSNTRFIDPNGVERIRP